MPGLYTHITRSDGLILTAAIYNADHQNHIDNHVPLQMDDYSSNVTQMQAATDPGAVGSESLATTLAGEVERLRFVLARLMGVANWYEAPAGTLGRNLLINGAMQVAQRGNQTGQGGATAYTAVDRWRVDFGGAPGGRFTTSRATDSLPGGFGYALKIDVTTAEAAVAATEAIVIEQPIEAQNLQHLRYGNAAAKTLVCSFWLRSPKTGIHCVALVQPDGGRSFVREFTVTTANTWEKFTVMFPGDASGMIDNNTDDGLRLVWPLVAGSNFQVAADAWAAGTDYATSNQQNLLDNVANDIYLAGVQLEMGTAATEFEHRPFGEELERCKRYFERWEAGDVNAAIAIGSMDSVSLFKSKISFIEKRAAPSFTFDGTNYLVDTAAGNFASGTPSASRITQRNAEFQLTDGAWGATAGQAGLALFNAVGAFINIDAEL